MVDYIINATGRKIDIGHSQSSLINALLSSGIIARNQFGGCQMSENKYNIMTNNQVNKDIYVIGDLLIICY